MMCKLLIMAIDSEKNYHGFRLHTKYAQSIVVSLIDQWMAEMTNYLNSYIMQRVEDVNAFANFLGSSVVIIILWGCLSNKSLIA